MLRLVLSGAMLASAVPAVAEDWRLTGMEDAAPNRQAGLADVDSIDRTNPQRPTYNEALLFETPSDGLSYGISRFVIDCAARTSRITHITAYGPDGSVAADEDTPDEIFEAIVPDSNADASRKGVCENNWSEKSKMGAGRSLDQVRAGIFKN